MQKMLISIPDDLAFRLRAAIPARKRSKEIVKLIEEEILKREQQLYDCAIAVEKNDALNNEMADWNVTLNDGLNDESW